MDKDNNQSLPPSSQAGNTDGREYHFQADFSISGAMYHVRFDEWESFAVAVDRMTQFVNMQDPIETAINQKPYNAAQNLQTGTCPKCGAPMKVSKAGNPFCSALCWTK